MTSPTQRALAHCKKMGWTAYVTEHWNAFAHIRQDLFGFVDMIVLDGLGGGPLAVQVTSDGNVSARVEKILAEPRAALWLKSPARIEVWGYGKKGAAGKRKLWTLRRVPITEIPTHEEPVTDPR